MPIPKAGDVIELRGHPWFGGDWPKLSDSKLWIVEYVRPKRSNEYWIMKLRNYHTGELVLHELPPYDHDGTWPLSENEFTIHTFLTQVYHANS